MGRHSLKQKPQLRAWLMEMISSGRYPGLSWLENPSNTFRIPWKHASRQDLCEADYRIFKDWAIASGRFTAGDSVDPAKWKTNFRCALNSIKSFHLQQDNSKESFDPHKIYFISGLTPTPAPDPRIGAVPEEDDDDWRQFISPETDPAMPKFALYTLQPSDHQEPLEEFFADLTLMNLSDSPADQLAPGLFQPMNLDHLPMGGHGNVMMPLGDPLQEAHQSPAQVVPGDQQWEPMLVPRSCEMENLAQEVPAQFPAPDPPLTPAPEVQLEAGAPGQFSFSQFPRDLDITIYYRGKEVHQTTVSNDLGCRFYHGQENATFAHLQQIKFPSTEAITDLKQKEFTDRLLSHIEGGFLLQCKNGGLYGRRLGKCQVFSSCSEPSDNQDSEKLKRDVETKIFSLRDFITDILGFMQQKRGMPLCSTYLCFGQHILEGNPKKKLILVKVVPRACSWLIELAQQQGASSLNSENVSLQISSSPSYDNVLALFKDLESMEVDLI